MNSLIDSKSSDQCIDPLANILDDVFKFLCALGFLVQLSYVLIRYSQFDYLTFGQFVVPDETILPDVFFCADFLAFLNYTLLFQRYPQLIRVLGLPGIQVATGKSIKEQIISRMTGEDASYLITSFLTLRQVTECLLPFDSIFGPLDIKMNFGKNVLDLCDLDLYYRKYMICFVFACSRNGSIVTTTNDFYKDPVPTELFLLRLQQSVFIATDFLFIGTTRPTTLPVSPTCKMDVQTIESYSRAFRYHLKTVKLELLPPPYPTSCRDYSKMQTNFTSRDGIIDSCLTKLSMLSTGCPHPLSLQSAHWGFRFASQCYRANSGNLTYRRLMNSIVDDCFHLNSQPDCSRIAYFLQGRAPVSISGNYSTLVMDEIKEPAIIVVYTPKMTWHDCLVQIGSVLGTWFGFSILIHIPKISRFLIYRVHSCVTCSLCFPTESRIKSKRKSQIESLSPVLRSSKSESRSRFSGHPIRYTSPDRIMTLQRILNNGSKNTTRKRPNHVFNK